MLLIYSPITSPRYHYICRVLFKSGFIITQDEAEFKNCSSAKLNYSDKVLSDQDLQIIPHGLLFQQQVQEQKTHCFEWRGLPAFFKTEEGEIPFDLLSAAFYLIARYEEWLPYQPDQYGRYAHTNSMAYQNNFLHLPLVQLWLLELESILQKQFPEYRLPASDFSFLLSYDIDIAYSYLHQPLIKNLYGFFRDLSKGKFELFQERANVYAGKERDPFDQFDFLRELHEQYQLPAIYFFLLADQRKGVDKNIHPSKKALLELIIATAAKYPVGIHPSWQSGDDPQLLDAEINKLSSLIQAPVESSRQHYLRMTIPQTYPLLLQAGIKKEYSLGYGTSNGFRASYAAPFFWFDLKNNCETELEIHPFCYMDANSIFELRQPVYEAKQELQQLMDQVKKVRGKMVCIFHNHFLTDQPEWVEWKKMLSEFVEENFSA